MITLLCKYGGSLPNYGCDNKMFGGKKRRAYPTSHHHLVTCNVNVTKFIDTCCFHAEYLACRNNQATAVPRTVIEKTNNSNSVIVKKNITYFGLVRSKSKQQ